MVEFREALRTAHVNGSRRNFPAAADPRVVDGLVFPAFRPKFAIQFDDTTIFTLGSCLARNIEEVLAVAGVHPPTLAFTAPADRRGLQILAVVTCRDHYIGTDRSPVR